MEITQLREITKADFNQVHQLIQELAVYELAESEVITTPEALFQDWQNKFFECLVLEQGSKIIGICLFNKAYSTWKGKTIYLEDLIITEAHRRNGNGSKLFQALLDWCKQNEITTLRWQVLKWNQLGLDFYEKFQATIDDEWYNGKISFLGK